MKFSSRDAYLNFIKNAPVAKGDTFLGNGRSDLIQIDKPAKKPRPVRTFSLPFFRGFK